MNLTPGGRTMSASSPARALTNPGKEAYGGGTINVMLGISLYSLQRGAPEGKQDIPELIIRIPSAELQ